MTRLVRAKNGSLWSAETGPEHYPQVSLRRPRLNPKGIPTRSPGLAQGTSAYPGCVVFSQSTPTRVASRAESSGSPTEPKVKQRQAETRTGRGKHRKDWESAKRTAMGPPSDRCDEGDRPVLTFASQRWLVFFALFQPLRCTPSPARLKRRPWASRSQPRWGWVVCGSVTQGSSFLATRGFEPESRWDSKYSTLDLWVMLRTCRRFSCGRRNG